ncbi:beta strand repeat-containing protein, partial [Ensifer sp.]|uniref:beta strand repeat-containing protein n=1 Tax=Ensifer sp. TaxID=1872086 RepID=UPI0028995CDC
MVAPRILNRKDLRTVLRRTTALTTVSLVTLSLFGPALADGGAGGDGAAGGTGYTGNPGAAGLFGAGGGGGAGGGNGGGSGGSGGNSVTSDGQHGSSSSASGGGGGGGYNGNGVGSATVVNTGTLSGGLGGNGGNVSDLAGFAGGGGAGGYGAVATGNGVHSNTGMIRGSNGGNGGTATNPAYAGNGGDGGIGLLFTTAGATLTNFGTIQGGAGGASARAAGRNGAGIVGTGLTIINSGTISGGPGAHAIDFTGGANALTLLNATSGLSGGIGVTGSLDFIQPTNTTVWNVISGTGSVSKSGAGTLTLTGANSYSGGTSLLGGQLAVANDINLGALSGGLVFNGGTLATTGTFTSARAVTLSGTGIFDVTSGTTLGLSDTISGTGGLMKNGAGTLLLSGANTYSGGTTVNDGILRKDGVNGLPGGAFTVNGGVLDLGGFLMQGTTSLSGTGGTIDSGPGLVILSIDQSTTTSFDGNFVGDFAITKTGSGSLTLNGVVDGIGTGINLSSGTLVLNGANTYGGGSGSTEFGDANLVVGNDAALSTSRVAVNGVNSNLSSNRTVTLANTFDVNRDANLRVSGANDLSLTGNIGETGSGPGGAVVKSGTGALTLEGTNSYSGGTVLSGGRLSVSSDNNLGAASGELTFNGGTLAATGTFNSARAVTLNGTGIFDVTAGATLGLTHTMTGTGGLVKNGTGTLSLSGANTYSGGTTVNAGVLKKDGASALPQGSFTVNGGVLDLGMPSYSTQNMTSLSGTGGTIHFGTNLVMLTIDQSTATSFNGDFTGIAGAISKSGTGNLTLNGAIGGMGTGIALSQGTLVLNGTNTYGGGSGSTLFGGANLVVGNDRALSTSRVTINNAGADLSSNKDVTLANNFVMSRSVGASLSVSGAHDLTLTGIVSESGSGGGGLLMKNGTGTLTLAGNNSYSGGTVVSGGRLQVSADRNLGALSGGLTFNGGTLATANTFDSARAVTLTGAGAVEVGGNAAVGLTGQITGAGSLQKSGTGLLRLTGTNTYLGGTELLGGAIEVGSDANLGNAAGRLNFGASGTQLSVTQSFDTGRLFAAQVGTQAEISTGAGVALGLTGGIDFTGATWTKTGAGALRLAGSGIKTIDDLRIAGGSVLVDGGSVTTGRVDVGTTAGPTRLTVSNGGTLKTTNPTGTGTIALGNALATGARLTIGAEVDTPSSPTAATAAGQVLADAIRFGHAGAALDFNHTSSGYQLASALQSGANGHGIINHYAGDTTLSGNSSGFSGAVNLAGGTLRVNGALGGTVDVADGATLGGSGTVGNTTVADGARLSPGNSIGTLTIAGNLALASGAILDYELGSAGTVGNPSLGRSDRIDVTGNLVLDGTINFAQSSNPADGTSGFGYYRLMTYGGILTDNGLTLGTSPTFADPSRLQLQAGGGRVDLFVASLGNDQLQHWQGGDGTWNATNTNWLNIGAGAPAGIVPVDWHGNTAVFKNEPGGFSGGKIAVSGGQTVRGLQFVDEGYRLAGSGTLATAAGGTEIRVLANRAEIATTIAGTGGLNKTEAGTLALTGTNSYSGGTTILGGAIEVSADVNLGALSGSLALDNGTLSTIGSFDSGRLVSLTGQGGFNVASTTTLGLAGAVSGTGTLVKTGAGTLKLTGTNGYAGGTSILGGVVQVSTDANLGAVSGGLALDNAALSTTGTFDSARSVSLIGQGSFNVASATTLGLNGTVSGTGSLVKTGAGTLKLTGTNAYAGGTSILGGVVEVAADASLGAAGGGLALDNAGLSTIGTFNSGRSVSLNGQGGFNVASATTLGLSGAVSGTGSLLKTGSGTLKLTGTNTYAGGTSILGGIVEVAADANLGASSGGVTINDAALSTSGSFDSARSVSLTGQGGFNVASATTLGLNGTINGSGSLVKTGAGTLKLTGTNAYAGGTSILGGIVEVAADANLGASSGGVTINDA